MDTATLYEVDPATILLPAGGQAFLQLLHRVDAAMIDDPSAALALLTSFAPPTSLDTARERFLQAHSARGRGAAVFDALAAEALNIGVLRETGSRDGPTLAISKALLAAINLVAGDLAGEIAAMGGAAAVYATEGAGAPLDHMLRQALGELTRLAVALAARRREFISGQLTRLEGQNKLPRLHLGAGGAYLEGWYNIDLAPAELSLSFRWNLPFAAGSTDFVFLSHLFEHLYKTRDAPRLLQEIHRVLKPGGVVRIVVPDAQAYMRAYVEGDEAFFAMQRRVWSTWAPKARTPLEAILGYLGAGEFPGAPPEHKYGYDFATLKVMLEEAGLRNVVRSTYMDSPHEPLRVDHVSAVASANADGRYASLFVEASK